MNPHTSVPTRPTGRMRNLARSCHLLAAGGVFVMLLASCSGRGMSAPTSAPTTTTVAPAPVQTTQCATVGADTAEPSVGHDPYAGAGARQRPGPSMTTVEIPSQPLERDVARPPDPDANEAARQPDGVEATDPAVVVDSVQPTAQPQPAASGAGCVVSTTGDDGP